MMGNKALQSGVYKSLKPLSNGSVSGKIIAKTFLAKQTDPKQRLRTACGRRLARAGDQNVILEAFKPGTEPNEMRRVLDGSEGSSAFTTPNRARRGLY